MTMEDEICDVYTYWEGPKPPWIELCLETIVRNIPGVQVLDKRSWHQIYDGALLSRAMFDRLTPNQQSDWVRAWLLSQRGGMWIDADAIVFRDIRPLFYELKPTEFGAYRAHGSDGLSEWCTALIAGTWRNPLGTAYLVNQRLAIGDGRQPLRRNALGPRCLWAAIEQFPDKIQEFDHRLIHPFPYWLSADPGALASPGSDHALGHLLWPDAYCFMLTHKALGDLVTWSREALLASDTLPGRCWRRALGWPDSVTTLSAGVLGVAPLGD
jgi:hypothetical protein